MERLDEQLASTDGPPPLHQRLMEEGIDDLAPFSRTRACLLSVQRVKLHVEPKASQPAGLLGLGRRAAWWAARNERSFLNDLLSAARCAASLVLVPHAPPLAGRPH